jgi:hypothetical protein
VVTAAAPEQPRISAPTSRKAYRTRSQAIGLLFVAAALLAIIVAGLVHAPGRFSGILIGSPLGLLAVLVPLRGAATILIVDDETVTVKNPVHTFRLAWAEIAAFDVGRYKILGCVLRIRRTNGDVVPVFAMQGITEQPRRRTSVEVHAAAEELNARLRAISLIDP